MKKNECRYSIHLSTSWIGQFAYLTVELGELQVHFFGDLDDTYYGHGLIFTLKINSIDEINASGLDKKWDISISPYLTYTHHIHNHIIIDTDTAICHQQINLILIIPSYPQKQSFRANYIITRQVEQQIGLLFSAISLPITNYNS